MSNERQFHMGVSWRLHETTVGRIVRKVEDLLVKCGKFRLPSQRQLYQPGWEWKVMVVDVGEMEIERPQKNKNATESGKQKCHTLKAQFLVEFESGQMIGTAMDMGKTHDFKLQRAQSLTFCIVTVVFSRPRLSGICQTPCGCLYSNEETSQATVAQSGEAA